MKPQGEPISSKGDSIESIRSLIVDFLEERKWGQFHSPKNLSMSLASEAGEILDLLRWLTEEESRNLDEPTFNNLKDEIGDVFISLLTLCSQVGIDPIEAARQKLVKLHNKYPKDHFCGKRS